MAISPELQKKIDALGDENLKSQVLDVLLGPWKKEVGDEKIFEMIVSSYRKAEEREARLRVWRDEEVIAFLEYFERKLPGRFFEFIKQERELGEIDVDLAWEVRDLIWEWMPGLDLMDNGELFVKLRGRARASLVGLVVGI